MIELLVAVLATYGVVSLLVDYDGPFNIFFKLRSMLSFLECSVCTSVWVAAPIAYFSEVGIVGYLAVIGGALLLDRIDL